MWNFLGAIASLLPEYMQGRRQAIQDNWADLSNYNQVQAGQLANAFTEGTWDYNMARARDAATNSGFQTWNNMLNTRTNTAWQPYQEMNAQMASWYAPYTAQYDNMAKIAAYQQMMRNPGLFMGMGNSLNPTPSGFGG